MSKILIITGDGGESYEALYAVHRFEEEGWEPVVAAPSRRRLNSMENRPARIMPAAWQLSMPGATEVDDRSRAECGGYRIE